MVPIRLDLVVDNARVLDTFLWNLRGCFNLVICLFFFFNSFSRRKIDYSRPLRRDVVRGPGLATKGRTHDRRFDSPTTRRTPRLRSSCSRRDCSPCTPWYLSLSLSSLSLFSLLLQNRNQSLNPLSPCSNFSYLGTLYSTMPECLVTIKVDLTVNQVLLHDQFEWDVNNPANLPEPFARSLCQDLGLSREFEATIAHSIREQLAVYLSSYTSSLPLILTCLFFSFLFFSFGVQVICYLLFSSLLFSLFSLFFPLFPSSFPTTNHSV